MTAQLEHFLIERSDVSDEGEIGQVRTRLVRRGRHDARATAAAYLI
jgi:hypothetical protein